jgi:hypothetical protein
VKVGSLIKNSRAWKNQPATGVVVDIIQDVHPKYVPKVSVLTESGIEYWIIQYCEVISER